MTEKLVALAGSVLGRRMSRRSALKRFATAGSAFMVAPLRYLLRPGTAFGAITCADCSSGSACCDGYTAFCCTINGGRNACPSYSYLAGWWKCTNYTGAGACRREGVRYYMDCNVKPSSRCPNGCRCANDKCYNRKTCCNVFRYGQCNTHIAGVTPIACRVIKCVNPCELYDFCNCTYKQDNNTCGHEAPCLQPYGAEMVSA